MSATCNWALTSNAQDAEGQRRASFHSPVLTPRSASASSLAAPCSRVRVGPFEKKEDGERSKEKLAQAGLETALVRVQR